MIVISKKRIEIILSCVIISVLAFSFKIAGKNNTNLNQEVNTANENTTETVSTPVSGKTVVVDAGHGVPDEGVSLLH